MMNDDENDDDDDDDGGGGDDDDDGGDDDNRPCRCWRGSYKILIREPPKSFPQELRTSMSRTWLCKIFMQGPVGEEFSRISTRAQANS